MKKRFLRTGVTLVTAMVLSLPAVTSAHLTQWIRIGAFQYRVTDSAQNSETTPGGNSLTYEGASGSQTWRWWGMRYAALDTEDAFPPLGSDAGAGYMFAGTHYGSGNEETDQWAIGDYTPGAATITSYWRQRPALVIVKGTQISSPFPVSGTYMYVDDGTHIPGTAAVLVESKARNQMGLEIVQRAFSWARKDFDDFVIYENHIINTGNTDRDDDIEVNTTLNGLYLNRGPSLAGNLWTEWHGMEVGDTMRIWYQYGGGSNSSYPSYMGYASGGWGQPPDASYLGASEFIGLLTIFAESTAMDNTDEWAQPVVHYTAGPDHQPIKAYAHNTDAGVTFDDWDNIYSIISHGPTDPNSGVTATTYNGKNGELEMMHENTRFTLRSDAGLWHETPSAWREDMNQAADANWAAAGWALQPHTSYGPYTLAQDDTVTLVTAWVAGGISEQVARDYGKIHKRGIDGKGTGLEAVTTFDWENMDDPPINVRRSALYTNAGVVDTNMLYKDKLVYSGRDSLLMHAEAAEYAFAHNYNIPIPPPAPDIEITVPNTGIEIHWGSDVSGGVGDVSEDVSDFKGYRVYRARGDVDSLWTMIADYEGTSTHMHVDTTAVPGQIYFYYVAAYDDGTDHPGDLFGPAGTELESGRFQNYTTLGVEAPAPPSDDPFNVVVVPNPYNLTSAFQSLHFLGEDNRNKITFFNLPEKCDIRIYSESGDLIKELEHRDMSGRESWGGLPNEYSVSQSGQIIVSGIYIAFIEELDSDTEESTGRTSFVKFIIVR